MSWTITGGTLSGTFAEEGISQARYTIQNGGQDSASFFIAGTVVPGTPPLALLDDVTLTYGGTVRFRGYVVACIPSATGSAEGWQVSLDGNMLKLGRCPYEQQIAISGGTGYTNRVNLGYDETGTRLNLAQTVEGIIDDTTSRHGLSSGTILSGYTSLAPQMQMQDVTVLEALQRCMAWCPDAVLWFDHSTSAINLTKPAGLSGVSIAGSGTGSGVTRIQPDQKKRLPVNGVKIVWEIQTTVEGETLMDLEVDTAGTTTGLDVPCITIPLQGGEYLVHRQECKTETIPRGFEDFSGADLKEWLGLHFPELKEWADGAHTSALSLVSLTQTVDTANKTGLGEIPTYTDAETEEQPAYPRRLVTGACPTWQAGVSAAPTTIKIVLKPGADYEDEASLANFFPGKVKTRELHLNVTGTDAETVNYQQVVQTAGAEEPVIGLAADWYAALNANAPAGTIERAGTEASLDLTPGKKVTVTGAFALTDAVIQALTVDIDAGRSVVTFGPQSRLTPGDLVELMRAGTRRSPVIPGSGAARTDAAPAGKTIEGTAAVAVKNTATPAPPASGGSFAPSLSGAGKVRVERGFVPATYIEGNPCGGYTLHNKLNEISWHEFPDLSDGDYMWLQFPFIQFAHGEALVDGEQAGDSLWESAGRYGADATWESGNPYPTEGEDFMVYMIAQYHVTDGIESLDDLRGGLYLSAIGVGGVRTSCG